jgi:AcrR family transcriptional regulator
MVASDERGGRGEVRPAVVREATRLFAERGFDGTALQDIADAVGVSKPAVLHYFPSKEHVRDAVLDGFLAHWKDALPQLLFAAPTGLGRFEAIFGALRRFFSEDPDRARLVLREMLDRPEAIRALLREAVRPWLAAIAGFIRAGQAGGTHHPDLDPEAYLLQMLQMVIAAGASNAVLPVALDDDLQAARARSDRELDRIARTALFAVRDPVPVPPAKPPTAPVKRRPTKR